MCEWAFDRAVQSVGCDAFDVKCDATNMRALKHYEESGRTHAANCIRTQCHTMRPHEMRDPADPVVRESSVPPRP